MICIEPNGNADAWPVYDAKDLFEPLGNVLREPRKSAPGSTAAAEVVRRVEALRADARITWRIL
ncbi:hypothetical protein [Nocardia amamiensis]|uniref:hypothetical protein n=1 Tax=Nocardia amamiensis TaxID=404578 RepID=UPI00082B106F|nr:hypothetical protein [Nocardia amamiensis]